MAMPETAMNEDDGPVPWQNDVGIAGEVTPMKTESKSLGKEPRTNVLFGAGVAALDRGHHFRANGLGDFVGHSCLCLSLAAVSATLALAYGRCDLELTILLKRSFSASLGSADRNRPIMDDYISVALHPSRGPLMPTGLALTAREGAAHLDFQNALAAPLVIDDLDVPEFELLHLVGAQAGVGHKEHEVTHRD